MSNYIQGFLGQQQAGVEARNDITVAIRNWFANRNPLITRLPYVPVERVNFLMYTHQYRSRSTTITTGLTASTTTGLTLADATFLMNHDVLQLIDTTSGSSEYVQINGDPTGTQTVTVIRGVAGTTATTSVATNSRREPDRQLAYGRRGDADRSNDRRLLAYAVLPDVPVPRADRRFGADRQAQVMPGGIQTPFDFNMTVQLQNMVDDMENCCYYGIAQAPTDAVNNSGVPITAKMNGLSNIFVTNNTSNSDERERLRLDGSHPRYAPGRAVQRRRARLARGLDQLHERVRDVGPGDPAHPGR